MRAWSNDAKPRNELDYHVEHDAGAGAGAGWRVVDRMGQPVGDAWPSRRAATTAAVARNAAAARAKGKKERPCVCCGQTFLSEGIHNRLCNSCRKRGSAEAMPVGYSFGSMTGRTRSA